MLPEFEDLMGRSVAKTDPKKLGWIGKELERPGRQLSAVSYQQEPKADR